MLRDRLLTPVTAAGPTTLLGRPAVTVRVGTKLLTEWKLESYGWLYTVGFIRRPGTDPRVERLARRVLDTWEWLPP